MTEVHLNIYMQQLYKANITFFRTKNFGGIRINSICHPSDDQIIPKIKSPFNYYLDTVRVKAHIFAIGQVSLDYTVKPV